MSTTAEKPPVRYAGFTRPRMVGLGDMSLPASLAILADLVVVMLTYNTVGWVGKSILVGQLLALTAACTFKNADGESQWARLTRRVRHAVYWRAGITRYRASLVSEQKLTGVLSESVALEYDTGLGQRFALIHHPYAQQYAVVLKCRPTGGERNDRRHKDQMTANWGAFGAALGNIPNAAQYTVVTESAPRSQAEARSTMESFVQEDSNDLAAQITRERIDLGVSSHSGNTTYVTVTFHATEKGTTAKAKDANALHIAQLLPGIIQRLTISGAGTVTPATEADLAEYVRAAIDPQARPFIEEARAKGQDTGVTWANCGPMAMTPHYDYLIHDQAISQTLVLTKAPAGAITDDVLRNILAPHPDIEIKRVALIKQVIEVGRAAVLTSRDAGNAELRREGNRRSGAARLEEQIANRTADEHAAGHGLEDFTIVITVTVTDPTHLAQAVQVVRSQLGPGAGFRFRPALDKQDTGFYYALPAGLDLHAHSATESVQRAATTAH